MLTIWWLTYLTRAGITPAGITDLAQPHTPLIFNNAKQVSSYAELNLSIEQSGSSINRSRLSKRGCSRLRKPLYMPALVAVRFNPQMLGLYHRLQARGKTKKAALVAVMRKLLVLTYGVLKSGKPFDESYSNP